MHSTAHVLRLPHEAQTAITEAKESQRKRSENSRGGILHRRKADKGTLAGHADKEREISYSEIERDLKHSEDVRIV